MTLYEVTVPIAGHAYVTVEADNEEEAIEKALNDVSIRNVKEWIDYPSDVREIKKDKTP